MDTRRKYFLDFDWNQLQSFREERRNYLCAMHITELTLFCFMVSNHMCVRSLENTYRTEVSVTLSREIVSFFGQSGRYNCKWIRLVLSPLQRDSPAWCTPSSRRWDYTCPWLHASWPNSTFYAWKNHSIHLPKE